MSSIPDRQLQVGDYFGRGADSIRKAYEDFNNHTHSAAAPLFTDLDVGFFSLIQVIDSNGLKAFPEGARGNVEDAFLITMNTAATRAVTYGSLLVGSAFVCSGVAVAEGSFDIVPSNPDAGFTLQERQMTRVRHLSGSFSGSIANFLYPILINPGYSGFITRLTMNAPIGRGRAQLYIDNQELTGQIILDNETRSISYSGQRRLSGFKPNSTVYLRFTDSSRSTSSPSLLLGTIQRSEASVGVGEDSLVSASESRRQFTGLVSTVGYYVRVLVIDRTGASTYYSNEPNGIRPSDHTFYSGSIYGPVDEVLVLPSLNDPGSARVVVVCQNGAGATTLVPIVEGINYVENVSIGGVLAIITRILRVDNVTEQTDLDLGRSLLPLRGGQGQVLGAAYYVRIRLRSNNQTVYYSNEPNPFRPAGYNFFNQQVLGAIRGVYGVYSTVNNPKDTRSFYLRSETVNGEPNDFLLDTSFYGFQYSGSNPTGLRGSAEVIYLQRVDGTSAQNDFVQGTPALAEQGAPTSPLGTDSTTLIGVISTQDTDGGARPLLTLDRLALRTASTPQFTYCLEVQLTQ